MSATNTNEYMVTLQVRHDADDTTTRDVAITVTNVEEDGAVTLNAGAAQRWHRNNRNPGRRGHL